MAINTSFSSKIDTDNLVHLTNYCISFEDHPGYQFYDYSPHSLRSGFTTQALRDNARLDKIPTVTRHKSIRSLEAYIKHEDRYEDHPGESFF